MIVCFAFYPNARGPRISTATRSGKIDTTRVAPLAYSTFSHHYLLAH
jgi:hypothetical protein